MHLTRSVSRGRLWILLLGLALFAGGVLAVSPATMAGEEKDKRVIKFKAKKKVFGVKGAEWTTRWWQWYFSIPGSVHPILDETGEYAEVGQRGPVWFLGGTSNESGSVLRNITIPTETALLFPLINVVWDNLGQDPPLTVEEMKEESSAVLNLIDAESLHVRLDGVPVRDLHKSRVDAGPFRYWCPEGNIYQARGRPGDKGIYSPAVSTGYWVMLAPLSTGKHTLEFGATIGAPVNFTLDITYEITVVESNQP